MFNKVQEVPRRDVVEPLSGSAKLGVDLLHGEVHVDYALAEGLVGGVHHDDLALVGRRPDQVHPLREALGQDIEGLRELLGHLEQAVTRPFTEPVDHATIEEGRGGGSTVREIWV